MGGGVEGGGDGGLVAEGPVIAELSGASSWILRAAGGGLEVDGQILEIAGDELGGVESGGAGFGDDERHRLAGVADGGVGEDRAAGRGAHAAVAVLDRARRRRCS